ncbi:DNA-processing protein DprA [Aureimonas sp. AU40]|uniref:DNA-processing protein DprA n=1 Tax=Aureimonas sp. AU40 TaxID=1637747 RepID=UPI000780D903|nr:DNA-processing protein DprA [Aureimonas sp. AU40]
MSLAAGERASLSEAERLARLRLIRSDNVGPATFHTLLRRFRTASEALAHLPELAARGGTRRRITICTSEAAEAEFMRLGRFGARLLCHDEADYPQALRAAEGAPPLLSVMGEVACLAKPSVAIVGSRNASAAGGRLTRMFATELGQAGYVIASGLARGIDTVAHEAALETGTIGVFAGGLDRPYPPQNKPLMRQIVDRGGCLVTEMPFGWEPRAVDFPRRNRIVVGLSLAVLVVEASLRSGSLISARLGAEMGRLVFAVPGSPLEVRSAGTNALLKDGAHLATETADLLQALQPMAERRTVSSEAEPTFFEGNAEPENGERERILRALGVAPVSLDDLSSHSGVAPAAIHLTLLELEIAGRLERHSGGRVSLLP